MSRGFLQPHDFIHPPTPLDFFERCQNVIHIIRPASPVFTVFRFIIEKNVERVSAEVLFRRSIGDNVNGVPLHRRQMLRQPLTLDRFHLGVVFIRSTLGKPRDDSQFRQKLFQ